MQTTKTWASNFGHLTRGKTPRNSIFRGINATPPTERCCFAQLVACFFAPLYGKLHYRRKQLISQGRLLGHYFPLKLYRLLVYKSLVYKLLGGGGGGVGGGGGGGGGGLQRPALQKGHSAVQRVLVFLCKNMQFTGQKAEQPASTACLLARKCH
jgi:hypothetical protein